MKEKKFAEMVIAERISFLLEQKAGNKRDALPDRWNELMEEADEEMKRWLEACLDEMVQTQTETQEEIYLGGFRDGVHVALEISRIGRETIQ